MWYIFKTSASIEFYSKVFMPSSTAKALVFFLMKLSICNAALLHPHTHKRKIHIQSDSRYINDFTSSNYNVMAQRKRDCKKKGTTVEQRSTQFQTYSS